MGQSGIAKVLEAAKDNPQAPQVDPFLTNGLDYAVSDYWEMVPLWRLTADLWGGTPVMRQGGKTYLPQFKNETDEDWLARLERTYLFPGFRRTVKALTGFPFSKPIRLEGTSDKILKWTENINFENESLDTWGQEVFEWALREGHTHILVDMPTIEGTVSKRDEQHYSLRPYLKHIRPRDIIGWKFATIRSVPVLTQLRIREVVKIDKSGFRYEQEYWERIRVYDLTEQGVVVTVFRSPISIPTVDNRSASSAYVTQAQTQEMTGSVRTGSGGWEIDTPATLLRNMDWIPLLTFYTNKIGFMKSTPGLIDLAYMNIEHWQSTSDQNNLLHFARVPRMAFYGWDEDTPINVDSGIGIKNSDTQAKAEWVELEGKSISSGRDSIKDIEERMAVEGVRLLSRGRAAGSATEAALNTLENMSELGTHAQTFSNILRHALHFMAMFAGEDDPEKAAGNVEVFNDFGLTLEETPELQVLMQSRIAGEISQELFLNELKRRGTIDNSVDITKEMTKSAKELDEKMDRELERVEAEAEIEAEANPPTNPALDAIKKSNSPTPNPGGFNVAGATNKKSSQNKREANKPKVKNPKPGGG